MIFIYLLQPLFTKLNFSTTTLCVTQLISPSLPFISAPPSNLFALFSPLLPESRLTMRIPFGVPFEPRRSTAAPTPLSPSAILQFPISPPLSLCQSTNAPISTLYLSVRADHAALSLVHTSRFITSKPSGKPCEPRRGAAFADLHPPHPLRHFPSLH